MSIRSAAFHEAGHAVTAWNSKFHSISPCPVSVSDDGYGECFPILSKMKLVAGGKTPVLGVENDKDVVRDLALVLVAGRMAEQVLSEVDEEVRFDPTASNHDYGMLADKLRSAGLSQKTDLAEAEVVELLRRKWQVVTALANWFETERTVAGEDLYDWFERNDPSS